MYNDRKCSVQSTLGAGVGKKCVLHHLADSPQGTGGAHVLMDTPSLLG